MAVLPEIFLRNPIAHRAYHDRSAGRPENSRGAVQAAIDAGYNIEIDVQLSADGQAMVFHDYDLRRLTPRGGRLAALTAEELSTVRLRDCEEGIPSLREILDLVAGQVGLLIEIKDQDGAMGPDTGLLEASVARELAGYAGPVAVMSFNPNAVAAFRVLMPQVAVGLTTSAYRAEDWPLLPATVRDTLRDIPDFDAVEASFISHEAADLESPRVSGLKAAGVPIFCWTIRSAAAEEKAREIADNVTFEGYAA